MNKLKLFNPKLDKNVTLKHPYTKTAFNIYKQMIKMGTPLTILPPGITYKNGRLYLHGAKNTTRTQKVAALLRKNKYRRMKQNFLVLAKEATTQRRQRMGALRKSLSAPNISFFQDYPKEHGKFRMMETYLRLAKPTANHKKVLKQLKKYVNKKWAALAGRTVFVEFDFVSVSLRYFEQIDDFSRTDFKKRMEQKIEQWTFDQQSYEAKHRYKMQGIRLFVSTADSGGCAKDGFPHLYGFPSKKLKPLIYCPVVNKNNCFLDCLHRFKHHSQTARHQARDDH